MYSVIIVILRGCRLFRDILFWWNPNGTLNFCLKTSKKYFWIDSVAFPAALLDLSCFSYPFLDVMDRKQRIYVLERWRQIFQAFNSSISEYWYIFYFLWVCTNLKGLMALKLSNAVQQFASRRPTKLSEIEAFGGHLSMH